MASLHWVIFARPRTTLAKEVAQTMRGFEELTGDVGPWELSHVEGSDYSAVLCYDERLELEHAELAQGLARSTGAAVHVVLTLWRDGDMHWIYDGATTHSTPLRPGVEAYELSEQLGCPLELWIPGRRDTFQLTIFEGVTLREFQAVVGTRFDSYRTPVSMQEVAGGVVLRPRYSTNERGTELQVLAEGPPFGVAEAELFPNHVVSLVSAKNDWSFFRYAAWRGVDDLGEFVVPFEEFDDEEDDDDYDPEEHSPVLTEVHGETEPREICAKLGVSESLLFGESPFRGSVEPGANGLWRRVL